MPGNNVTNLGMAGRWLVMADVTLDTQFQALEWNGAEFEAKGEFLTDGFLGGLHVDADPLGNLHVAATVIPDINVDQWNVRYLRFEPDGEVVSAWVSCMAQLSDIVALSDGTPIVSYSNPLPGNTIQLASPG